MTDQPNQFDAILPHFTQMADAAAFMHNHSLRMYSTATAMVKDMEHTASNLRAEEAQMEQEHAVRIARIRGHINTVENMIAHHMGVMRTDPQQVIDHNAMTNIVAMPKRRAFETLPRKKIMGLF